LTDKKGIPLSAVISSASTHDINLATDVVDNAVIKRPKSSNSKSKSRRGIKRRKLQHLCLDKGYNSVQEEQELIKRDYVLHIPIKKEKEKRKGKGEGKEDEEEGKVMTFCKNTLQRDGL
jgi:hypothetical protein